MLREPGRSRAQDVGLGRSMEDELWLEGWVGQTGRAGQRRKDREAATACPSHERSILGPEGPAEPTHRPARKGDWSCRDER
jgi:hypothetical protein